MSATYQCWLDMKGRCYNQNSQRYYTHGARGITVCDKWRDSFDAFLADMGEKPDGFTLDRVDNDGNYEPSNCKWSTPKEQANNRSTCIYVEYNGETKTVKQWSEELGISFSALLKRLRNWPLDKALTAKIQEVQEVPDEIKKEILDLWITTELSQKEVAAMYGISQACISKWHKKEQHGNQEVD